PPDRFSAREACRLLRLWCAHPSINRLLEGDPVHCLKNAVKRQRHNCRNSTEPARPARRSGVDVKSEEQDEKSSNDDRHAYELAEMDSGPITTVGILGKGGWVVIGIFPTGMEDAR